MPKRKRKFGALILTNGRPDKVVTYKQLRKQGYTGPIWLVVDDLDAALPDYQERYGDEVIVFDKREIASRVDAGDITGDLRTSMYARNAMPEVAASLGLTHYIMLDDDYTNFSYRLRHDDAEEDWQARRLDARQIRNLDGVFAALVDLLEDTGALTVAMAQGGEMIGGVASHVARLGWKRKAMNSFVCRTDRPVPFVGRLNEDVTAYCLGGMRGDLYMTISSVSLSQLLSQQNPGGMTDIYIDSGTYVKTFYTVMMCPSFVSVRSIGPSERRLHHHIDWPHAIPKLLAPELAKADG